MSPSGRAIVEVEAPTATSGSVRLRLVTGEVIGDPFDWAHLSVRDVDAVAVSAGLTVDTTWTQDARWFVSLCHQLSRSTR